jgi:hypothetical protein
VIGFEWKPRSVRLTCMHNFLFALTSILFITKVFGFTYVTFLFLSCDCVKDFR